MSNPRIASLEREIGSLRLRIEVEERNGHDPRGLKLRVDEAQAEIEELRGRPAGQAPRLQRQRPGPRIPAHEVAALLQGLEAGLLAAWTSPSGIQALYPDGRIFRRNGGTWEVVMTVSTPAERLAEWWRRYRDANAVRIVVLVEEAPVNT